MPQYRRYPEGLRAELTEQEKALVRGMNYGGETKFGIVTRRSDGNIAALHFDGQLLIDAVYAMEQIAKTKERR